MEVQLLFELLVAIQILQRVGGADFQHDERIAVARFSELAIAHAIRARCRELEVLDRLVPPHERVVRAHLVAEKLFRCLQCADREKNCQSRRADA